MPYDTKHLPKKGKTLKNASPTLPKRKQSYKSRKDILQHTHSVKHEEWKSYYKPVRKNRKTGK